MRWVVAGDLLDPWLGRRAGVGMIFTVIIALEFKRSLLVSAERHHSIVQVRTVILAIVRKLLILDVGHATEELFALAAAIIALGRSIGWCATRIDPSDGSGTPAEERSVKRPKSGARLPPRSKSPSS